jgi:hypothetical protein
MLAVIVLHISNLPNWIQAGAAVALVVLTAATLWVLKRYADDTATIAKVSALQEENSQMPFLGLVKRRSQSANFIIPYWVIQNQGFGPALKVRFSVRSQEGTENQGTISALAQGEEHNLAGDAGKLVKPGTVLRIEYSSCRA